MMWKRLIAVALVLAIGTTGLTATAAGHESVYVFSRQGNAFSMNQQSGALTFWEAPDVITGQSHTGGTLTLRNDSDRTVDFVLTSVSLPYDNTAALTYLDAVTLSIKNGDTVLYHDTFTRLMDADRPEIRLADVGPGEQAQLTMAIACAYTYTGGIPSYTSLVWTFTPELQSVSTTAPVPIQPGWTLDWLRIAQVAGAVVLVMGAAGVCVWLRRRKKKKE